MRGGLATFLTGPEEVTPSVAEKVVFDFLRQVPPFRFLDDVILHEVVAQAEIQYFPAGTQILRQAGPTPGFLYVIERGEVKKSLRAEADTEAVVEVVGSGDLFGVLSTLEGSASRMHVVALEDTVCYAIPQPVVRALMEAHPTFAEYLLHFSIHRYLDWSLDEIRRGAMLGDASGRLMFMGHVGDLARKPVVTCQQEASIQEVARLMTAHRVSSVVVVDGAGKAVGIVTDWDLRERVVAVARDVREPVVAVMSAPVVTVSASAPVYEALHAMIARNIHHLVVTEGERPIGMVTSHDLIVLQGTSALSIVREIERQRDLAGLRQVLERAQEIIPFLLRQGVRAGHLGWIMADINDRFVARVLALTEATMGAPPVPYSWLVLGSEGRREQTFKTDQDNAIIYVDPDPEEAAAVREYFLAFGRRVVSSLVTVGFPPCPARYTADNPRWVQPLSGWLEQFRRWIMTRDADEVANFLIFFDFRGIHGDSALAARLWADIMAEVRKQPWFLNRLAHLSTAIEPPLGFLGRFVVERDGEHKGELDLKTRGTVPVVDLARFFALRYGMTETNTLGRLDLVRQTDGLPDGMVQELIQAFEFMLDLRIRHQWEAIRAGRSPSNYINPRDLSVLDRRLLKEAFRAVARAQAAVRQKYHTRTGRLYS